MKAHGEKQLPVGVAGGAMRTLIASILLALVLCQGTGCASCLGRFFAGMGGEKHGVYPGVRLGVTLAPRMMVESARDQGPPLYIATPIALGVLVFCIADLPFSAVADTVLLPLDLNEPPPGEPFTF